jgi:hypothetical protein
MQPMLSGERLNGHQLIAKVIEGVMFVDGVLEEAAG